MKRWLSRLRDTGSAEAAAGESLRWVVLDVETSGFDRARDRLISIGAVAVRDRRIVLADSLEVTLQQASASARENILVHGIGQEAQEHGVDPASALAQFIDYIGTSPLLAFHASFDRGFVARAAAAWLGITVGNPWIDLAGLVRAVYPEIRAQGLDEWLESFGIAAEQRHNAGADALATAMLFLRVLRALPGNEREPQHLQRIAASARWLGR